MLSILWAIVVFTGMLVLPGWAMLAIGRNWHRWQGLQRWIIAISLSIAFYPVFFYGMRFALPWLTLGPYKMGAFLLLCAGFVGWRMRHNWKEQFAFDWLEWAALAVFGMTLFTRFWIIRDHPYPAWSDSLHHTILTQLTAVQGRLPTTMEPYFPIPLEQYHLGLYSLSATVQWLAQVPAHTALLWTAQALNGLCGLGVYLVLDRKVGRVGAIIGAAVVGLWSHQPAWYVNWGRFTQVASQTILLPAWLVTWEAVAMWKRSERGSRDRFLWYIIAAAVLTGAVFLLHFRVAVFYLLLLGISVLWELWRGWREKFLVRIAFGIVAVGLTCLIVITPALWDAVRSYVDANKDADVAQLALGADQVARSMQVYYEFPWSAVPVLAARPWLLVLAGLGIGIGTWRRDRAAIVALAWVSGLYLIGNAYRLGIPALSVTNMGAILIMLYLPIGLVLGAGLQKAIALFDFRWRTYVHRWVVALTLVSGFVASHVRVTEIESYRYFVTAEDIAAMDWIRANVPEDAIFAVNTYFWQPQSPHGTDGGYWIPYFTGRRTNVDCMLMNLGDWDYVVHLLEMSQAEERLAADNVALADLGTMGVHYIYVGKRGDFSGPGLNAPQLSQSENVQVLYQSDGVAILQIKPPQ